MGKIVMGTSLAPFDVEKQLECVKTWIDNGFEVVSFNIREEIVALESDFKGTGVVFYEVNRTAIEETGKPLPFLADILHEVSGRADSVCGFFNSDIYLHGISKDLYEYIEDETADSLTFMQRNEISEYEDIKQMKFKIHFEGIDVFFIDKKYSNLLDEENLFVQSVWDLLILEICRIHGVSTKELINPVAFHKRHSIKWNFEMPNYFAEAFEEKHYKTKDNAYENAWRRYYTDLFEYVKQICFCKNTVDKCLFVLDNSKTKTVESVKRQEYPAIYISEEDTEREDFDYVFYIAPETILNENYCKAVIWMMEQFSVNELKMGVFFLTEVKRRARYNNLNRSMNVVYHINDECKLESVIRCKKTVEEKRAELCYPISYRMVDRQSKGIECIQLNGEAYLMPAGVRASEWYKINNWKLNNLKISGYIDNNKEKIGTTAWGKKIFGVEQITERDKEAWVIIASKYYGNEIKKQLIQEVDEKRILDAGYVVEIDEDGKVYLLNTRMYGTN